jgi:hypothetical protein
MCGFLYDDDIYQDAYTEGRLAYLAGKALTDNPYDPYDRSFRQWSSGWQTELEILESRRADLEE